MAIFKPETPYVTPAVALPAAGAFLDPPMLQAVKSFEKFVFFVEYTSAAIGGAPSFRVETEQNNGDVVLATFASSATQIDVQEMQGPIATGVGQVTRFEVYVQNKGGVDRLRLNVRETGVPATPGDIEIRFVAATYAG